MKKLAKIYKDSTVVKNYKPTRVLYEHLFLHDYSCYEYYYLFFYFFYHYMINIVIELIFPLYFSFDNILGSSA